MRQLRAMAAVFVLATTVEPACASERPVQLGEVSVVAQNGKGMEPALRTAVEDELKDLDLHGSKQEAIMSASLVKLEQNGQTVTCVVSATLRTRKGGAIFATLEGRALATGSSDRLRTTAMRTAVRGAVRRVPDALK